jgi:threonine/homoserine/homoserine lactone efflux protein
MTLESTIAFSAAFFLLAASPGPGLAAILSRSMGAGIYSGLAVTVGLILGDAVFLFAAIIGLSVIASLLGPLFAIVKYAGAAYLIWLGIKTLRNAGSKVTVKPTNAASLFKDFGLGLFVTLGNPKPIIFYGALLPAFVELQAVSMSDLALLIGIVTLISLVVYGFYMILAARSRCFLVSSRFSTRLNQATGVTLIGTGLTVASR